MVSAGIVSRHPAGLLHQLPGGDALAGRIVPHDEDRLLKKRWSGESTTTTRLEMPFTIRFTPPASHRI